MSCIIQKSENTAALANWIANLLNMSHEYNGMEVPDDLRIALHDLGCVDDCGYYRESLVYNALADLNSRAFAGRYKEEAPELTPYKQNRIAKRVEWAAGEQDERGHYSRSHYTVESWHYKIFKMLQFFNYQCAEYPTYKTDLFKALKQLEKALACFIVQNTDTYQNFDWE